MQANLFQRIEETPAHRFKTEIRRKQREKIKSSIMGKFRMQQAIGSCLKKMHDIVFENIDFIKFVEDRKGGDQGKYEGRTVIMDYGNGEFQKMDLAELITLVTELNYCLSQFPLDQLEELIMPYNDEVQIGRFELCQKDPQLYERFKNLIKFLIPHIFFIIRQLVNSRQKLQESWLRSCIKNHKGANLYGLKSEIVSILIQLSSISCLGCFYIFGDPNSDFEEYFFDRYYGWQAFQVISEYISGYLHATQSWYHCILGMSNLLYIQFENGRNRNDEQNKGSKHIRQILNGINFDHILFIKLSLFCQGYENMEQGLKGVEGDSCGEYQQRVRKQEQFQKIFIHFVKVYVRWNASIDYEMDLFLVSQIEKYIASFMYHVVHFSNVFGQSSVFQQNHRVFVAEFEWKIIQQISQFLEYFKMRMDNVFIINALFPIIRSHWERPEIARIWKNISFNNDYKLPVLIGISDKQVHIYSHKDNITVKPSKIDDSDSEHDRTAHFAPHEVSPIKPIFQEILNTIVQTQVYRVTNKRDKDLMQGLFNVMLEMEPDEACELWQQVYERNEGLKYQMGNVENVKVNLEEIENYVLKMKEQ